MSCLCCSVAPLVPVRVATLRTSSKMNFQEISTRQSSSVSQLKLHQFKLKTSLTARWTENVKVFMVLRAVDVSYSWMTWTCPPNKSMVPNLQLNWSGNSSIREDGMNIRIRRNLSGTSLTPYWSARWAHPAVVDHSLPQEFWDISLSLHSPVSKTKP